MIHHEEIKNRLQDYLENLLDEDEKKQFDIHLSSCSDCQREFNQLKSLFFELNHIPQMEPPSDLSFIIMNQIRNEEKSFSLPEIIKFLFPKIGYAYGFGLMVMALMGYLGYQYYLSIQWSEIRLSTLFSISAKYLTELFVWITKGMAEIWIASESLLGMAFSTVSTLLLIETILIIAAIMFWYYRKQKSMHLIFT